MGYNRLNKRSDQDRIEMLYMREMRGLKGDISRNGDNFVFNNSNECDCKERSVRRNS